MQGISIPKLVVSTGKLRRVLGSNWCFVADYVGQMLRRMKGDAVLSAFSESHTDAIVCTLPFPFLGSMSTYNSSGAMELWALYLYEPVLGA